MDRRTLITSTIILASGGSGCMAMNEETSTPTSEGPIRGEANTDISTQMEEPLADVELVENNKKVRFPVTQSGGGSAEYDTAPWERWAKKRCASAAKSQAVQFTSERLGIEVQGGTKDDRVHIILSTIVEDGEVTKTPSVEFNQLVSATPRSVNTTYILEDRELNYDVPTYAYNEVVHM